MLTKRINRLSRNKINLGPPFLTKADEKAVIKVLRSGQLSLGPRVTKFEKAFASWIGAKYAVAVSSGTAALHLCIRALGINQNDEVITTPFSFIASANCILYEKAKPVFVDIDQQTFNIDVNKIEKAVTHKTKAILPVHIFGYPADLDEIMALSQKYKLAVIEDAAEALGASYKGKRIGSFGNLTVFAFYPNKQMTTAEGGMITTNNKKQYDFLKSLTNQGRADHDKWLYHQYLGYNYRMDEINASLGITQLDKLDLFLKSRQEVASWYHYFLQKSPQLNLLPEKDSLKTRSWFVYVIKLDKKINRDFVIKKLNQKGIPSRAYLPPIHLQPFYKKMFGYKIDDFPICERISSQALALPFYTGMKKKTVAFICKNLKEILKSAS